MSEIRPYSVKVSDDQIKELTGRLRLSRLPEKETVDDWSQGVPLSYVKNILDYWLNDYDFKRLESRLNEHENFITEIDGVDIHFMHQATTMPNHCCLPMGGRALLLNF